MDEAVRAELDHLLGYMRACRTRLASLDPGELPGPEVPDSANYMRAMTWAQANGGLRMLQHLHLIGDAEREAWEQEAQTLVDRPPGR